MNKNYSFLLVLIVLVFNSFLSFGVSEKDTINIDFGVSSLKADTTTWNNIFGDYTSGSALNLRTSLNKTTGLDLHIRNPFYYSFSTGDTAEASLNIPLNASIDGFFGNTVALNGAVTKISSFVIHGLSASVQYSFQFFGSRDGATDNRETKYKIIGVASDSASIDAASNKTNVATILNIVPVGDSIVVAITAGSNNTSSNGYYYLNAMKIMYASSEAPATPTGLAAKTISSNSVTLSWNKSSDDNAVSGYYVYANSKLSATVTDTTVTVSSLSDATSYLFTVKAFDADNNLSKADSVKVTTLDGTAPGTPLNLSSSDISYNSFTLSWDASTDNVAVAGYTVLKDGDSIAYTTTNSVAVAGLSAGTTYSMTVKAIDAAGNYSAVSSALSVKTSSITGVENVADNDIKVYPNPTTNYITVDVAENGILLILSNSGKGLVCKALVAGANKIDFDLPSGIYVVKVVSASGLVLTDKLIVK